MTVPIPQAGAPVLNSAPGLLPATIYYVQIAWVSATGQEGAPSNVTAFQAPLASLMTVTNGAAPPVATGFNVYVGLTDGTATLQNTVPIAVGQTFIEADTGLMAGVAVGTGQTPEIYVTGGSVLRRG